MSYLQFQFNLQSNKLPQDIKKTFTSQFQFPLFRHQLSRTFPIGPSNLRPPDQPPEASPVKIAAQFRHAHRTRVCVHAWRTSSSSHHLFALFPQNYPRAKLLTLLVAVVGKWIKFKIACQLSRFRTVCAHTHVHIIRRFVECRCGSMSWLNDCLEQVDMWNAIKVTRTLVYDVIIKRRDRDTPYFYFPSPFLLFINNSSTTLNSW